MRGLAVLLLGLGAAAGCADAPVADAPGAHDPIDIARVGAGVEIQRGSLHIAVAATASAVTLRAELGAGTLAIDAVATGPGVPITATLRVAPDADAALAVRNDLVVLGDVSYRLGAWRERNAVIASLAPSVTAALAEVAPYRMAIEARLAEAAPVLAVVGLFQAWPDGTEPAWPVLDDPRDREPPGQLAGDIAGVGMTCSAAIRCPNSAPYCVTRSHDMTFGVCTRACADDAACGAGGRCAQPVVDIPDVAEPVLTCAIDCAAGACPGLLACSADTAMCDATQDHVTSGG